MLLHLFQFLPSVIFWAAASMKSEELSSQLHHRSVLFRQLNISPWLEFSSGVCEGNRWGSPFPLDRHTVEKAWPLPDEYPFHSSPTTIQSQNSNEISETCLSANCIVLSYAGSQRGNWSPIKYDISAVFLSQGDLTHPTNLLLGSLGSLHHIIPYFSTNICCRRQM